MRAAWSDGLDAALLLVAPESRGKEGDDGAQIKQWFDGPCLHQHHIVNRSGKGSDIGESVQVVPCRRAESADGSVVGGDGEGNHRGESDHADDDVPPLHQIGGHFGPTKAHVEDDPSRQVHRHVEKGEQADGAAEADQVQARPAQGGDDQAADKELKAEFAKAQFDRLDRIGRASCRERVYDDV